MAARLSLTLTESDVNVANNTSKVTAKLYYYGNGVSYNNNNPSGTIKIDGTSYSFNSNFGTSTSAQLLATKSKTVTHNADGSKTVTVSATFKTGVSLGTLTTSKSITLTTIPRASQPSVNKASLVIDGSDSARTVVINTNRASSSFKHTLECKIGNTVLATFSNVEASYSWIIPMETLDYITNKTSETITITCKTYNGSTLLGTKTTTLVATTPSIPPTIGTITMAHGVAMPSGITAYVQGKSKLSLTVPVTLAYSSPVAKIEVTIGGVTYVANSPSGTGSYVVVTDYLSMSGNNLPITVKVTDGRGNSATDTSKTITIPSYTPATVSNVSYQHMSDTVTRLHVQGYVTDLAGSNSSPTIKVYFKKVSETAYPSANVVSNTVSTGSFNKDIEVTVEDVNIAYEYKIVITDKFGNSNEYILKTGIVVLSRKAGGTGVTLFEEATEDGFVVGGGKPVKFTNPLGISSGGTGATTASDARINLGLGSVATEDILPQAKGGSGAALLRNAFSASVITTATITLNAQQCKVDQTITATKEGFYPFGVVGFYANGTNAGRISFGKMYMSSRSSGSVTIKYTLSNWSSQYDFSGTIVFHMLWIKES